MENPNAEDNHAPHAPDPAFDGHLEHPMQSLSDGERLKLIWEGTLLLHWAKAMKRRGPADPAAEPPPPGEGAQGNQ